MRSYSPTSLPSLAASLTLIALIAAACADDTTAPPPDEASVSADRFGPPDIVVSSASSIQAAVDAAAPGDVIHIEPGTYSEGIVVAKRGIRLIGLGGPGAVVIENPGAVDNGITVTDDGDHFTLDNVTVRDFEENGVLLVGVEHFRISRVLTEDNGEYGIFPVLSAFGTVEHSSASGHSDAGIYVGQSRNVIVRHNVAFGNVNGFEIENSSQIRMSDNESYGNTAGMLIVLLPGLSVKESARIEVYRNDVHDNDLPNFADPGEIAAVVPPGSGILVIGTDKTRVKFNTVTGNDFVGIGVGSTLLLGELAGLPPEAFADIEPNPDHARIQHNVVTGNGANPPPLGLPGVDLFWDGSGANNCWGGNTFDSSAPSPLPNCGG